MFESATDEQDDELDEIGSISSFSASFLATKLLPIITAVCSLCNSMYSFVVVSSEEDVAEEAVDDEEEEEEDDDDDGSLEEMTLLVLTQVWLSSIIASFLNNCVATSLSFSIILLIGSVKTTGVSTLELCLFVLISFACNCCWLKFCL